MVLSTKIISNSTVVNLFMAFSALLERGFLFDGSGARSFFNQFAFCRNRLVGPCFSLTLVIGHCDSASQTIR